MAHIPVLLNEAIYGLDIKTGDKILDATFGGGGHSALICERVGKKGMVLAIDADPLATTRSKKRDFSRCGFTLTIGNFRNLDEILVRSGINVIDGAIFDLGLSSFQLDESGRGFSFQKDEPLEMTFYSGNNADDAHNTNGLTAGEIINNWDENNLADVIYGYGGEQFAKRIAGEIIRARQEAPIVTTFDLVTIIERAVPNFYKSKKLHYATKTFQAIRIAVNDELGALKEALPKAWKVLSPGGRLAVISFHELEDRIVKFFLKDKKMAGEAIVITKKPIVPSQVEIKQNPRSRSAKLRIAEKI